MSKLIGNPQADAAIVGRLGQDDKAKEADAVRAAFVLSKQDLLAGVADYSGSDEELRQRMALAGSIPAAKELEAHFKGKKPMSPAILSAYVEAVAEVAMGATNEHGQMTQGGFVRKGAAQLGGGSGSKQRG